MNRASPELIKVAPQDKIEHLFKVFAERLGPLKEYKAAMENLICQSQLRKAK